MLGAAAMSGCMTGSLESSRRSGLVVSRCPLQPAAARPRWCSKYACSALDVGGPAGGIADGVEMHPHARQPGLRVEARRQLDDLGVDGRTGVADRLHVELPELPVAAGLRAVVAEHRARSGSP